MRVFVLLSVTLLGLALLGSSFQDQGISEFVRQLQEDLEALRLEPYLEACAPELRDGQREAWSFYFDKLKMESVTVRWANPGGVDPADPLIFLRVILQNPLSVMIETWQLRLENVGGRWQIKQRNVRGSISQVYKIKLPSGRVEKAASVEIRHHDIQLTFKNAVLFYDNIPELETALLIIGEGRLTFSPSDANERHQLDLLFKKPVLTDALDYAFLRFSNSFFKQNIKITQSAGAPAYVASEVEKNKAYALFMKYYPRYFTVQSSLSPDPLSFLPQGDEAVIEFSGRKVGELAYVYSSFAEEEISLYDFKRGRFINLYSPAEEEGKKRLVVTFGQRADVQDYQIELDFQPQTSYLSAKTRIRLVSQVGGLDTLKFKFNPELEILRIYDGERRELFFTQDRAGRILYVYFLEPVARNAETAVEVYYRGRLEPPVQVTDTVLAGQISDEEAALPVRYDTYLFSQSAEWYPAPPDEDYFTARLRIIVPPGYSSISNGQLLERGVVNGIQRVTEIAKIGSLSSVFETKSPVKYLSFLVGKLTLVQEEDSPLPLAAYASSEGRSSRRNLLEEAGRVLRFYETRFGDFPFENLRIIQRLWRTDGGHSPASFIVLNERPRSATPDTGITVSFVMRPISPVDLSQWREYFLAHEIAHQWWGQGVTWARYRDQWLSEGLAQYSSVLYIQSKHGASALSAILKKFSRWTEKKAKWGPITLGSRLSFLDFEAYQAIIYNKASLVLHMLRELLGEETFFSGLRDFFSRHRYSAASTSHFKRAMERASGRSLDEFFTPWLDSHFLPEVRASSAVVKNEAGDLLKITVAQLKDVFVFPLWVAWADENGRVHREKLVVERKTQEFELPVSGAVKKFEVNPDRAVPGKFSLAKG
ncbi:MAG: M1 family aminopeptidase [Acidobacteriota bacterium]